MNNLNDDNSPEQVPENDQCKQGFFRRFAQKRRIKRRAWWKQKRINRMSAKLNLEPSQRDALAAIFTEMELAKTAAFDSRKNVGTGLLSAIQGGEFDDKLVVKAMQAPIDNMRSKMDTVIQRFGEWFNQLNLSQQQQLRGMLQNRFSRCGPSFSQ